MRYYEDPSLPSIQTSNKSRSDSLDCALGDTDLYRG